MVNENGILFAVELDGNGSLSEIDDLTQWKSSQKTLWFHLDLSDENAQTWVAQESNLSKITSEALTQDDTRPRISSLDGGLLVCLNGVNCNPGQDPEDMVSLRLWISRNRIISMRHHPVMAVNDLKILLENRNGPKNTGDFLVLLCERLTDRISDVVNDINIGVDGFEEEMLGKDRSSIRNELTNYRRMIIRLRRYVVPQREMFWRLQSEAIEWMSEVNRLHMRENTERIIRCVEDLDAAHARAVVAQDELNAGLSEQMNRTVYTMSIIATIFLPLGLFTGLLGTNVGGIPGNNAPFGFLVVCLFLVIIAIVEFIYFKRKRVI